MSGTWWEPDQNEVDAVMAYRLRLRDLTEESQCYVVAELSELGMTTASIAERMRCSQRQVKRIRSRVLTQQMRLVSRYRLELEHSERKRSDAFLRAEALQREIDGRGKQTWF